MKSRLFAQLEKQDFFLDFMAIVGSKINKFILVDLDLKLKYEPHKHATKFY
jgi:hypothetical protein